MVCTARLAPIALWLVACSPTTPEASTGGTTSTGGSASTGDATGTTTPTTGAASTDSGEEPGTAGSGTGEPTTDATTSTTSTTSTTTTDATTTDATTGAASATTTGETTGEPGSTGTSESTGGLPPVTRAWWVNGQELQIRIIQEDLDAGLCRGVILGVDQFVQKYAPVEAPQDWDVRYVFVHAGPGACFDPYLWYENQPAYAGSATGSVVFHDLDGEGKPATLDIEVTGAYAPGEPWTPLADTLSATAVLVEAG